MWVRVRPKDRKHKNCFLGGNWGTEVYAKEMHQCTLDEGWGLSFPLLRHRCGFEQFPRPSQPGVGSMLGICSPQWLPAGSSAWLHLCAQGHPSSRQQEAPCRDTTHTTFWSSFGKWKCLTECLTVYSTECPTEWRGDSMALHPIGPDVLIPK